MSGLHRDYPPSGLRLPIATGKKKYGCDGGNESYANMRCLELCSSNGTAVESLSKAITWIQMICGNELGILRGQWPKPAAKKRAFGIDVWRRGRPYRCMFLSATYNIFASFLSLCLFFWPLIYYFSISVCKGLLSRPQGRNCFKCSHIGPPRSVQVCADCSLLN